MTINISAIYDGTETFWTPNMEEAEEQGFIVTREGVLVSAFVSGDDEDELTPDEATRAFVAIGHHDEATMRGYAEQYAAHRLDGADTRIDSRELRHEHGRFQVGDDRFNIDVTWVFQETSPDDPEAVALTTARRHDIA